MKNVKRDCLLVLTQFIQDQTYQNADEDDLKKTRPEMPRHGSHFVEIDLAEGDEEHQEHEQRQDRFKDGGEEDGCVFQAWREAENQVDNGTDAHCHRQCPVLDDSDNPFHY